MNKNIRQVPPQLEWVIRVYGEDSIRQANRNTVLGRSIFMTANVLLVEKHSNF